MTEEILKLAKSVRHNMTGDGYLFDEYGIETFYRAAFNAGLEAGAKVCESSDRYRGDYFASKVRALKEQS